MVLKKEYLCEIISSKMKGIYSQYDRPGMDTYTSGLISGLSVMFDVLDLTEEEENYLQSQIDRIYHMRKDLHMD